MLFISIISIFAIIQLRSSTPTCSYLEPKKAHVWSLLILTHLTFNHRSLSTVVDAPEQLWHAGAGDEVD